MSRSSGQQLVAEEGRAPDVGTHVAARRRGVGEQQVGLELQPDEDHRAGDDRQRQPRLRGPPPEPLVARPTPLILAPRAADRPGERPSKSPGSPGEHESDEGREVEGDVRPDRRPEAAGPHRQTPQHHAEEGEGKGGHRLEVDDAEEHARAHDRDQIAVALVPGAEKVTAFSISSASRCMTSAAAWPASCDVVQGEELDPGVLLDLLDRGPHDLGELDRPPPAPGRLRTPERMIRFSALRRIRVARWSSSPSPARTSASEPLTSSSSITSS